MFVELSMLPPEVQKQLQKGELVQIVDHGKVIGQMVKQPSYAVGDFNFDLERMKQHIDCGFVEVPQGVAKDLDSFTHWIESQS